MTALERAPEDRFADAHEMALLLERHAFRTDDFDPAQLVTQLKQLFPADHAGWKATVGTAQVVEASGHRKITAAFPLLGGASTHTGGPTLALHKKRAERGDDARRDRADVPGGAVVADLEDSGEHPALPRLTGWGDAQPEPGSEGGELSSGIGDDAAAYAALRRWAVEANPAARAGVAVAAGRGDVRGGRVRGPALAGARAGHATFDRRRPRRGARGGSAAGGRAASVGRGFAEPGGCAGARRARRPRL